MAEEELILRERATTPRYMHNAFLVILDVANSGDLFSPAKAQAYYVLKLYNHFAGIFQFKCTFIHKFPYLLNFNVKTHYAFTPHPSVKVFKV